MPDVLIFAFAIISIILTTKLTSFFTKLQSQLTQINVSDSANGSIVENVFGGLRRASKFTQKSNFLSVSGTENIRLAMLKQKKLKMKYQAKRFTNWLIPILFELLFLILLAVSGGIWPSVLSVPYFLLFLIIITYWSCMRSSILPSFINQKFPTNTTITTTTVLPNTENVELDTQLNASQQLTVEKKADGCSKKLESVIKVFLLIYLAIHVLVMYLYQFHFFQSYLNDNNLITRLLGLYPAVIRRCDIPAHVNFQYNMKFQQITYPFILIFFYWILSFEFAYIKNMKNDVQVCLLGKGGGRVCRNVKICFF